VLGPSRNEAIGLGSLLHHRDRFSPSSAQNDILVGVPPVSELLVATLIAMIHTESRLKISFG